MDTNENMNENQHHLKELGGSDYKIVDGEENIKGWDVKNAQGIKLGEVDELLFDEASLKVRYIVLDLDNNDLDIDFDDKKVLIPIGMAELDEKEDDVFLRNITIQQLQSMSEYDKDNLNSDLELSNYSTLTGVAAATTAADMYDNEHFSDENLFRNRKRDRPNTEGDMEIPVVNKEARVVEEIKINKETTEHNDTIHDTIRRTDVQVDDIKDEFMDKDVNDI